MPIHTLTNPRRGGSRHAIARVELTALAGMGIRPLVTAGELTLVSARKGPAQPLARGGCPARMRPRQSDGRFVTYTGFLMALANTTVTA